MWTERQLKLLEAGGNGKLYEFCEKYGLNSIDIRLKYQTRALIYYRRRTEALALERQFNDPEPSVEEGRKLIDGSSVDKKEEEERKIDEQPPVIVTPQQDQEEQINQ